MIRKVYNVNNYWKVIVYYNVNYNFFDYIEDDLIKINASDKVIDRIYYNMHSRYAKACTISSFKHKTSVVLFNSHSNYYDYVNSIIHEAEHVKQSMLEYYKIPDKGEAPAYTIGYLASQFIGEINNIHYSY